jgi:hypothetical protein
MQILVVNFELKDMSLSEFRTMCDELAPTFAEVPGLISKLWLINEDTGTVGGVYSFRDAQALKAFQNSELFAAVGGNPHFVNIRATEFGILEGPTRITHGLAAAIA